MSLLIAVKSCQRDLNLGLHQAIRETWASNLPLFVDLQFFYGGEGWVHPARMDETKVYCKDDYDHLADKTREICDWFCNGFDNDWSHMMLVDCDTFLIPGLLVKSGYEKYDFSGFICGQRVIGKTFDYLDDRNQRYPQCHPWMSGGIGYFLSRRAAKVVSKATPKSWAEDLSVGQILGPYVQLGYLTCSQLDINEKSAWHIRKSGKYPVTTPEVIQRCFKSGTPDEFYKEIRLDAAR